MSVNELRNNALFHPSASFYVSSPVYYRPTRWLLQYFYITIHTTRIEVKGGVQTAALQLPNIE